MQRNSFPSLAEQIVIFNNNVVDLLSKITKLISTTDSSITFNTIDQTGISSQFSLPSFGFLKSEIDRLNNNVNSIYSVSEAGALIQPTNGTRFKKIITVDLNKEPNDISNLDLISTFTSTRNLFFDSMLDPTLSVELDLTGQIENNVRKILCRRYIPEFAKDTSGNFTTLGQAAISSFNNLFRNKNTFSLEEYETWHRTTPGLVEPLYPKYDEQMFDLQPNQLELDGLFSVISTEEDTLNRKLWYNVDSLIYVKNRFDTEGNPYKEKMQLAVGDELVVNIPLATTRYKIIEISTSSSYPRLRFERIEGFDPIPVGTFTLKIYSPVLYNKKVLVTVGYNERNVIFVKALNMDNYIMSKNWSKGVGYWTSDLKEITTGTTLNQYYSDFVNDYGVVLSDLVAKKIPNKLAGTPNVVQLNSNNFKVVQINKHLTDTPDANLLKSKHNIQKNLKSELEQLNQAIQEKNKQLRLTRFTSQSAKNQFLNDLNLLQSQKNNKSKLLASTTTEILELSKVSLYDIQPSFRLRGFWSFPEAVATRGTRPQEIVQFRVQWRYMSKDGRENSLETFKLNGDLPNSKSKTAAFSSWTEYLTDARKRVYDANTGLYTWQIEDVSDPDTPNINQLDIPIKQGERIEFRIKSISEVGWPDSPVESDWSDILSIDFPDDLNNVLNENQFILKEADKEDLRVSVQNDLSARGLDEHLSEQVTINDKVYTHYSESILSGFKDENGVSIDLYQYLTILNNRIISLEEKIRRVKGELEISVYRNSEQFIVKNGTELVFNVECEDYLDQYTAPGVASGRVYQNNVYVIKDFLLKIRNKSVESPLGLLSNRVYTSGNSDVLNTSSPQVFFTDQQNNLLVSNSSGVTKTQIDNQFIWAVNYDNVNTNSITKLSDDIANSFVSDNTNSLTSVLSSSEYNIGYYNQSILNFVGNNLSLMESGKWIDKVISIASTTKLLTTVHPQIQSFNSIQETNSDKIKTVDGGAQNDINIPLNIYFKMNALDNSQSGLNYNYINLNGIKTTVVHTKKLKFFLENENDNRPTIFSIKFVINRARTVVRKTIASTPIELMSSK